MSTLWTRHPTFLCFLKKFVIIVINVYIPFICVLLILSSCTPLTSSTHFPIYNDLHFTPCSWVFVPVFSLCFCVLGVYVFRLCFLQWCKNMADVPLLDRTKAKVPYLTSKSVNKINFYFNWLHTSALWFLAGFFKCMVFKCSSVLCN